MKRIYRPHPVLCFSGSIFSFLIIFGPLVMVTAFLYFIFREGADVSYLMCLFFGVALEILAVYLMYQMGQLIWGKIVLTETEIVWKCIFCRSVKIKYSNIKILCFKNFNDRNVVRVDLYNTGFRYLLISEGCLPQLPIYKIRCGKGIIKWQCSEKFLRDFKNKLPAQLKNRLNQYGRR